MADLQERAEGAAQVTLFSEGAALPETVQLLSLTVTRAIHSMPMACLTLFDGDLEAAEFPLSDSGQFAPGATIRIDAGYDAEQSTIFEGIVTRHAVKIGGENESSLVVECRTSQTDGELMAIDAQPALRFTWGDDLMEFHAELDASAQFLPAPGEQPAPGTACIRGRMRFQGSAKAQVGCAIEVLGVGKRFSGLVFVAGLTHAIRDGDWVTDVEFGPSGATESPLKGCSR